MVLDQRGPSWYAVRYGFRSEMAPLGTPFVMVLVQKGPQLALFGARFCLRNVEVGPQINTQLKTNFSSELSAVGAKRGVRSVRTHEN